MIARKLFSAGYFLPAYFFLQLFISCKPSEETGLAQYFFYNNSDYDLSVKAAFMSSVSNPCNNCNVGSHTKIKIGNDSNFGHAPTPDEAILSVAIYKSDTLKINFSKPFGDTVWIREKGENKYDNNYILEVQNQDVQ